MPFFTLLGARAVYILFYNLPYYQKFPHKIFNIWEGGMSFHGALLGIFLATFLIAKIKKNNVLFFLDLLAICAPLTLFFGRIGNFINGELAGKVTTVPWAIIFTQHYDLNPRHPSQLYEAIFEGLLLFILLWKLRHTLIPHAGRATAFFLIFYGTVRFIIEFFRLKDPQLDYILKIFTLGQIQCLIMIITGMAIIKWKLNDQSER